MLNGYGEMIDPGGKLVYDDIGDEVCGGAVVLIDRGPRKAGALGDSRHRHGARLTHYRGRSLDERVSALLAVLRQGGRLDLGHADIVPRTGGYLISSGGRQEDLVVGRHSRCELRHLAPAYPRCQGAH